MTMRIDEMINQLDELVSDPEKAAVIFKTILESDNPDIIQRTMELYVLLILHHGEDIQKALNDETDKQESYEDIIRKLEQDLSKHQKDHDYYKQLQREKEAAANDWDEIMKDIKPVKKWLDIDEQTMKDIMGEKDPPF